MAPLPPGSTASTIWSRRWRRIRWACMRTQNTFGMAIGDPMTYGTNPSHTPVVFSAPPIVRNPPPLPP